MLSFSEAQLLGWIGAFFWPFLRISGMLLAAPVFNSRQIPMRLKLGLALLITLLLVPLLPPPPAVDLFSEAALMIGLQQLLIGIVMGFVVQMALAAVVFGGQVIAYSMGLGFASMVDPQNGAQTPVVSQFYLILATLAFLMLNGHLLLIELLVDSFTTLPVAADGIGQAQLRELLAWGSRMFAGGLLMALPIMAALLMFNIGMGVVMRAAPQLNIFAIGFPMTMLMGFAVIWVTLPDVLALFSELLDDAYGLVMALVRLR